MDKKILLRIFLTFFVLLSLTACAGNVAGDATRSIFSNAQASSFEELSAGYVFGSLREGETNTYTVSGTDYEVTAVFISQGDGREGEARFAVNGELSDMIREGASHGFNNGLTLIISFIDQNEPRVNFILTQTPVPPENTIRDTLREGETKTYSILGITYETTAVFISDPGQGTQVVRFAVNGELTDTLSVEQVYRLKDGSRIMPEDIIVTRREGIVEFTLVGSGNQEPTPPTPVPPRPVPSPDNNVDVFNFGEVLKSRLYAVDNRASFGFNPPGPVPQIDIKVTCNQAEDVMISVHCDANTRDGQPLPVRYSYGWDSMSNQGECSAKEPTGYEGVIDINIRGVCLSVN